MTVSPSLDHIDMDSDGDILQKLDFDLSILQGEDKETELTLDLNFNNPNWVSSGREMDNLEITVNHEYFYSE